jgi:hypothetical protein
LEHDLRTTAPAHATGAVEFVALDDIAPDETFRLRPDGDVALLATSLGRLGQLAPIELRPWRGASSDGPRWQVVSGFRRLAAVRLLARERVLARLHADLSDEDAWGLALAEALLREPLSAAELEALRARLLATGVAPWADELVDEARVRAPVDGELRERFYEYLANANANASSSSSPTTPLPDPPPAPRGEGVSLLETTSRATASESSADAQEVTPEELAHDLAARLSQASQDLALAVEAWDDLPREGRRAILEQARYIAQLMPFLERE